MQPNSERASQVSSDSGRFSLEGGLVAWSGAAAAGLGERAGAKEAKVAREPVAAGVLPRKLGRYALFDHIGRGGMANIYLARTETEAGARLVVIKEVLPKLAGNPGFADMLVNEANIAAHFANENVTKVEELGRDGDSLFIAMEYVEGIDLREMLRRCAKLRVPLPVELSLRVVIELLKGLEYAHGVRDDDGEPLDIVHRDVSPSNVLLSFAGDVKLCDFGIAHAQGLPGPATDDAIMGKAGYMSPEHAKGARVDSRADVFAAGIILWELLAGRRLYKAADGESLLEVARRAAIPALRMRGLPLEAELHAMVMRALEVDREARYPSAGAMQADLEAYVELAELHAGPERLGAWLFGHFGEDVVGKRRARERVVVALEKGPPVTLVPIEPTTGPEHGETPSTFPVALFATHPAPELSVAKVAVAEPSASVGTRVAPWRAFVWPIALAVIAVALLLALLARS